MLTIFCLLGYASLTVLVAPMILTRGSWQVLFPRTALLAWHLALGSGIAALLGSMVWALIIVASYEEHPVAADSSAGVEALAIVAFAWTSLAVLGAGIAVLGAASEPLLTDQQRQAAAIRRIASATGYRSTLLGGMRVTYIRSERAFACAVGAPEATILITDRLERALTAAQLDAVIEHERTHLRQHHAMAMQIARLNAACAPRLFGARELERASNLLIELIADDAAARRRGAVHLANALAITAEIESDESMLLRAERVASKSWRPSRRVLSRSRLALNC